jgi:STE24 endopeptidase
VLDRTRPTPARTALAVLLAAVWIAVAWWLLRTEVPSLELPSVDEEAVLDRDLVERAERYERLLLVLWVLAQAVLVAVLTVYARRGAHLRRDSAAGPVGTGMLLGMVGLALVWAAQLPLVLVAAWWARRYEVSRADARDVLVDQSVNLLVSFVVLCVAVLVVMQLARRLGDRWWAPGAALLVALAAVVVWASPLAPAGLSPADDPALVARYHRLAAAQDLDGIGLRIARVGDRTRRANAFARGLAGTSEVVVWDTLLDGRFDEREVDVVLAHELAHHARSHLWKALAWFALVAVPGAWLLMRATRRRGGLASPEAVPLALLVVALLQLALTPAQAWISRGLERDADWRALESTQDPAAARTLFAKLAEASLRDPDPPRWSSLLLATHPTPAQRVAFTEAWERLRRGEVSD